MGAGARYYKDIGDLVFKRACCAPNLFSITINDLKPARWYHARVAIDYLGFHVVSETKSFHTVASVPSTPTVPRVYVIPVVNSFDLSSDLPSRHDLMFSWSACAPNGSPIISYQVQLRRINASGKPIVDGDKTFRKFKSGALHKPDDVLVASLGGRDKVSNQWIHSPNKSVAEIKNSLIRRVKSANPALYGAGSSADTRQNGRALSPAGSFSPNDSPTQYSYDLFASISASKQEVPHKQWTILYNNISRSVKVSSPLSSDAEWHVRVRAKNALGWSLFSDVIKMNRSTYPSLFSSSLPTATVMENRKISNLQSDEEPVLRSGADGAASSSDLNSFSGEYAAMSQQRGGYPHQQMEVSGTESAFKSDNLRASRRSFLAYAPEPAATTAANAVMGSMRESGALTAGGGSGGDSTTSSSRPSRRSFAGQPLAPGATAHNHGGDSDVVKHSDIDEAIKPVRSFDRVQAASSTLMPPGLTISTTNTTSNHSGNEYAADKKWTGMSPFYHYKEQTLKEDMERKKLNDEKEDEWINDVYQRAQEVGRRSSFASRSSDGFEANTPTNLQKAGRLGGSMSSLPSLPGDVTASNNTGSNTPTNLKHQRSLSQLPHIAAAAK